ncbi:TonB-linked SusC/RagA family outer membrane protein [Breznakibacter xylanolyticus]|uniref:TonB-linked SusC/RagA family outer membrane protein n=1 Tax=Breznakibacter xylanolyticus TaxID=990 RepID=A0A2W7Q540_9BACT|nr:TonB-dependent receptor [Breznakibacter xylanolyticus]PZX16819.1 TonB-linked SusC/RagA family outer membrane protein [Breznakibacter xylanolyticus]
MKKRGVILLLCLLVGFAAFAQKKVSGKVTDNQNDPIPGVTVVEKGTTNGAITDMDGNFSLTVPGDNTILVFSFVGMKSQEITVGTQSTINVMLESDMSDLDEVVVVGYGVQKKKLVTGATIQVGGENLQKLSTNTALGALQSQAPGVNITQSSGQPGEAFKVTIRGLGTVGNSSPLYVIDGVAGGDINSLNPADIESIDVLKDAASAAIYGARAANGVILVTTKQGKSGKMQVTYDGYYGVQNVYKMPSLLNAKEYMAMMDETRFNDGKDGYDWEGMMPELYEKIQAGEWNGTNWLEEMRVKNAATQSHAVNITGGTDVSRVSLGFSYSSQEGILGNPVQSNYDRYTARLNSEHVVYSKNDMDVITVGENLTYSYNTRNGIQIGNIYSNDIHSALVACPLMPMYDEDGNYFDAADKKTAGLDKYDSYILNPVALMEYRSGYNLSKNYNLQGNAYLVIQPVKDLKYKSTFGYKMNGSSYRQYRPTFELASTGDGYNPTNDRTQQSLNLGYQWQWENTLAYNIRKDLHMIDALVGQSVEKFGLGENVDATNAKSVFSDFDHAWLTNTQGFTEGVTNIKGAPWDEGALASFFGRVNYNFNETYMASLVMRADASSNFARGNRWGYFPSVSAGWVITNEDFMSATSSFMDFLKLRASWGQNGNCNIKNFQYLATVGFPETSKYSFGGTKTEQSSGGYQNILANPDVKWETSEQLNLGFDARFLGSRMGLAFDWYKKTTKDWLVLAPAPATYGTGAPYVNGGDVENTGIEIALNWNDQLGDLTYGVSVNMAYNQNEVTRIANSEGIIHGRTNVLSQGTTEMYRAEVGKPIGYFWGYKTEGIFQNQSQIDARRADASNGVLDGAQPGDVIFADTNHDNVIDEKDKVEIGNPHPDVTSGLNINLGYKGFDFSVTATGAFGHQIAKSYRSFADSEKQNYTTEIFGRWYGEGTSNKLPRLTPGTHTNWQNISDIYIEDGDYVKLTNISVGYDFKKLFKGMPLQQARLYFAAQNLYTFTGYSGMDPEVGYGYSGGDTSNDSNWSSGIDLGFYPSPRTYLVGVNLKF